jgi:predicted Fe-Mo cluster-binding NifX family protein
VDQNAEVVMSGDFGPNASRAFQTANVDMRRFTESTATDQDAVDHFKQGKLLN